MHWLNAKGLYAFMSDEMQIRSLFPLNHTKCGSGAVYDTPNRRENSKDPPPPKGSWNQKKVGMRQDPPPPPVPPPPPPPPPCPVPPPPSPLPFFVFFFSCPLLYFAPRIFTPPPGAWSRRTGSSPSASAQAPGSSSAASVFQGGGAAVFIGARWLVCYSVPGTE